MQRSKFVSAFVVTALVVAACGSDDSDTGSTESTTEATGTDVATTEPTATATETTTSETATTEAASTATTASTEPPAEIVLTDSFQGVTTEEIDLGVIFIDFEQMNQNFGFDFDVVPVADLHDAWATAINETGGINGRNVNVSAKGILPVGNTEAEAACVELLEDEQVFAVMGQLLLDNALCITETYGHPYLSFPGGTREQEGRSEGRFFSVDMSAFDQAANGAQLLLDAGVFDGERVGIVWTDPQSAGDAADVAAVLAEGGVELTSQIEVGSMGVDAVANDAAWSATIERLESEGTTVMYAPTDLGVFNAADTAGTSMAVATNESQIADGTTFVSQLSATDETMANSLAAAVYRPTADELAADPEVQRCIDEYDAAFPDAPLDTSDVGVLNALVVQCRGFRLMTAILTEAGGDITPETFQAAGESLAEFSLPGAPVSYLGTDKHGAGAQMVRYEWNSDQQQFVVVGEPVQFIP